MDSGGSKNPESVMIQINGLMLTLLLLFSQLVSSEPERIPYSFFLMGTIGTFFLFSLVVGVIILFYEINDDLLNILRHAEMMLFLGGAFFLTLLIIAGYRLSGYDPAAIFYVIMVFMVLALGPYIEIKIKDFLKKKRR